PHPDLCPLGRRIRQPHWPNPAGPWPILAGFYAIGGEQISPSGPTLNREPAMSAKKPSTPAPTAETQPASAPQSQGEPMLKSDELEERVNPVSVRLSANHNESLLG
ncbi:MAG TPA: hypothetical protein VFN08_06565, partial [Gemmatimonadales bacterium]|nr:hypothetical protein [Gemmatimonadales bacterium]